MPERIWLHTEDQFALGAERRSNDRTGAVGVPSVRADTRTMGGFLQLPPKIIGLGIAEPDIELIERAYTVAAYWHRDQRRYSGEPYIRHPAAVATIAAGMGMGVSGVCAALLHDVLEDTDCPPAELRREFGKQIADLVEGITRWTAAGSYATSVNVVDGPVIKLKLADRLHNMQTLRWVPRVKQERVCRETLDFFVPLAAGLDMHTVGEQLRELAVGISDPSRLVTGKPYQPEVAHHRSILAVDVESSTQRPDQIKARLRQAMYTILERALGAGGLTDEHHDPFLDRGDGILTLIHPVEQAPKSRILDTVVPELSRLLADHNAHHPTHRFRLRVVVHAGEVRYDRRGCFGEALDIAFRLLDAPELKQALRRTPGPLVLIVSEDIYRSVVRHGYDRIDSRTFVPLVSTQIDGWRQRGWVTDLNPGTAKINARPKIDTTSLHMGV
jgi:hypothetical protein